MQLPNINSFGWSLSQIPVQVLEPLQPFLGSNRYMDLSRRALAAPGVLPRCCLCCPFTPCAVVLPSLHTLKETITLSSFFFFFCLLFHIKWELCLFRLPLQLNTHIIQARDKMEEHFFFQVHLASNLPNKLFYHIILTLDRRAYQESQWFRRVKPK